MSSRDCVVIVDPLSTGAAIAVDIASKGFPVVAVYDKDLTEDVRGHVPVCARSLKYAAVVQEKENASIKETATAVREAVDKLGFKLGAIICGSEPGVTLADALSAELAVRTNGVSDGRRDKKRQQELVKAAGLRSVRQAGGTQLADFKEFLQSEPMPVVVKPVESAGSDGVKLCHSSEEAEEHIALLMNSQRKCGSQNAAVVCQEFLKGKEYVIDHVSRDGVHKCMMVWVYDKRKANGGDFVYYGMLPVAVDSKEAQEMIPYIRGVLDALGIKNGPSHGEVIMTQRGPCLVEMNCRAHGGDAAWDPLAMELTGGFTQVNCTFSAFMDEEAFAKIPDVPPSPYKAVGQEVDLVSFTEGIVKSTPGYDYIKTLDSFVSLETSIGPGTKVERTVDIFTCVGCVIVMHHDAETLAKDIATIRQLETDCKLFEFMPISQNLAHPERVRLMSDMSSPKSISNPGSPKISPQASPKMTAFNRKLSEDFEFELVFNPPDRPMKEPTKKECIVMVDPISTGANMAVEAASRGYPLVALYDKDLTEDVRGHVPLCARSLQYAAIVQEEENAGVQETAKAVKEVIDKLGLKLGAVICGSEPGVSLADAVSSELGVRTNGVSDGRRDKKRQQELVKAAGLRSVRQAGGKQISDIKDFLQSESMPVVVKPVESAGSDGVKLCHSIEEAEEHFTLLMSSQRKCGSQNAAVLCQEFLKGKEYVVDHVSRDGVHKTTMVWVYDKRKANGGDFVYYGMIPVAIDSKEAQEMIPYVRGVLDALGIKNGPSHGEVMMTQRGPCLVEMNCRAHGGDGAWEPLARELTGGFTQVNCSIDAYTDEDAFAKIPNLPPAPYKAVGQEIDLVSFAQGTVKSTPGYDKIQEMDSFVSLETGVELGTKVERTVDIFTMAGAVILMHHDAEVLEKDIATIRQMEIDCKLFEFEPEPVRLGRPVDVSLGTST